MGIKGQAPAKTPDQPNGDQPSTKLLQLHLEEYKALVYRSTALIGQMFGIMAIGFGYLGYVINNWKPSADNRSPTVAGTPSGTGDHTILACASSDRVWNHRLY